RGHRFAPAPTLCPPPAPPRCRRSWPAVTNSFFSLFQMRVSEIEGEASISISPIGIPNGIVGITDNIAVVDERGLTIHRRERHKGVGARMDIEDIVSADGELQALGYGVS